MLMQWFVFMVNACKLGTMKENYKNKTSKPLFHGVILVAGGAIGAGMFALPLVAAGAWYAWSLCAMIVVWWFTYLAAGMLAEVNFQFAENSSFDSIVKALLGPYWAAVNNVSIAFIMYILMYAYITSGGGILDGSIKSVIEFPRYILSLIFALIAAAIVCLNTSFVSRISAVLMVGMGLSFVTANSGLFVSVNIQSLVIESHFDRLPYVAFAVPVYITAFACAGLVPSLVSHYYQKPKMVLQSLLYGTLLTLLIYTLWLSLTLGNIERVNFNQVAQNGGGLDALVGALKSGLTSTKIQAALSWFSHLAIITSFLSIAVGLVHFLQDRFKLGSSINGRLKAVMMAFFPPTILSMVWAYGFVSAIGYAGLLVAISFFIVPALLYAKQNTPCSFSHKARWVSVLIFGVLVVLLKFAALASMLPRFPT